jgi:hypothetical protein
MTKHLLLHLNEVTPWESELGEHASEALSQSRIITSPSRRFANKLDKKPGEHTLFYIHRGDHAIILVRAGSAA